MDGLATTWVSHARSYGNRTRVTHVSGNRFELPECDWPQRRYGSVYQLHSSMLTRRHRQRREDARRGERQHAHHGAELHERRERDLAHHLLRPSPFSSPSLPHTNTQSIVQAARPVDAVPDRRLADPRVPDQHGRLRRRAREPDEPRHQGHHRHPRDGRHGGARGEQRGERELHGASD